MNVWSDFPRSLKGRCHSNQFCGQNPPQIHTLYFAWHSLGRRRRHKQEGRLLCRAQANRLPDSMDAGEQFNWPINNKLTGGEGISGWAIDRLCLAVAIASLGTVTTFIHSTTFSCLAASRWQIGSVNASDVLVLFLFRGLRFCWLTYSDGPKTTCKKGVEIPPTGKGNWGGICATENYCNSEMCKNGWILTFAQYIYGQLLPSAIYRCIGLVH